MRPTGLLMLILCFGALGGCHSEPEDPRERLLGTWGLELDLTFSIDPELSELNHTNRLHVERLAGPFLNALRMTFSQDGELLTTAGKHRVRTRYVIDKADDGRLLLTVTDPRPESSRPTEQMQIVFSKKHMQLARGNQTLVLSRR